jgi:hypothetical protein
VTGIHVRDAKNADGPVLSVSARAWVAFLLTAGHLTH